MPRDESLQPDRGPTEAEVEAGLRRLYATEPSPELERATALRAEVALDGLAREQAAGWKWRRVALRPMALVLLAAVLMGATYAIATMIGQAPLAGLGPGQPLRCLGLGTMAPQRAEAVLEDHGYSVSWRLTTTVDGELARSEERDRPPAGVITDAVVEGDRVIVFVSPADDPLAEAGPLTRSTPADC